jgi:Serine/threonine protein kinase
MHMGRKQPPSGLPAEGDLFAGRYRIRSPIGQGGMGSVLLAEDERLGNKLRALKFTDSRFDADSPEEERFIAEARILSQLQHPHLPQIVDYYGTSDRAPACIVMDYIAGESLATRWLHQGLRLPFEEVLGYMVQLCDVLRYLHAQRPPVVFRDLKPANVMIDHRGRAILVDFGIARRYRAEAATDTTKLGTPGFAAPEQLRGSQSDERTDLYGLGALVYYLLSGGELASHGYRPDACNKDVPRRFRDLLAQLLAVRPSHRPASAQRLLEELRGYLPASSSIKKDIFRREELRPSLRQAPESGSKIAAVVSAYPGAGATFVAMSLSSRLTALSAPHSVVECPGGDPEMFSWLDGERRMPARSAFCDPSGVLPIAPSWRQGRAAYYPLNPEDGSRRPPEPAFADWLRRLDGRIVLLDVSSRWENPAVEEWVAANADCFLFVADSLPLRWSERRQRALLRIREHARMRGADSVWIANRDLRFGSRNEWIGMLPEPPLFSVPDVPYPDVVRSLWKGEHPPLENGTIVAIDRFLERLWEDRPTGGRRASRISKGWHR